MEGSSSMRANLVFPLPSKSSLLPLLSKSHFFPSQISPPPTAGREKKTGGCNGRQREGPWLEEGRQLKEYAGEPGVPTAGTISCAASICAASICCAATTGTASCSAPNLAASKSMGWLF
ncbi:unnamed protein product [Urochloa humidicola]